MNQLHTVEIVACMKRQMRHIHHKMIDNLDNKFNPIDIELDEKLNKQIDELSNSLKHFSIKESCSFSDMYLRVYS